MSSVERSEHLYLRSRGDELTGRFYRPAKSQAGLELEHPQGQESADGTWLTAMSARPQQPGAVVGARPLPVAPWPGQTPADRCVQMPAPALARDRPGWSREFPARQRSPRARSCPSRWWLPLSKTWDTQRSCSVCHRLLTVRNAVCYFNGDGAHKFQPAASRFPSWTRGGLVDAVQGCVLYRAKESRSVQECSLCFCIVPDLRRRPGLLPAAAALGALLRCQPRRALCWSR